MNNINDDLITACEYSQINIIEKLLNDPEIDLSYNDYEAYKMACFNGDYNVVDLFLYKIKKKCNLERDEKLCKELIQWIIIDNNKEMWYIMKKHFGKDPLYVEILSKTIPELKFIDNDDIPEDKMVMVVYMPYSFYIYKLLLVACQCTGLNRMITYIN